MKAQILWRWHLLYRFCILGNVKKNELKQRSYDLNKGSSTGKSLERFHTDSHPFLPHKMRKYLMNIAFGACFGDRFFDFWGTTIIQIGWSWKGFKNSSIENAEAKNPPKRFYPSMFFHFHNDLEMDGSNPNTFQQLTFCTVCISPSYDKLLKNSFQPCKKPWDETLCESGPVRTKYIGFTYILKKNNRRLNPILWPKTAVTFCGKVSTPNFPTFQPRNREKRRVSLVELLDLQLSAISEWFWFDPRNHGH